MLSDRDRLLAGTLRRDGRKSIRHHRILAAHRSKTTSMRCQDRGSEAHRSWNMQPEKATVDLRTIPLQNSCSGASMPTAYSAQQNPYAGQNSRLTGRA